MPNPTVTYRLKMTLYDDVRALLGNGVVKIRSPISHKGTEDWLECDVQNSAVETIEALGGEKVIPR